MGKTRRTAAAAADALAADEAALAQRIAANAAERQEAEARLAALERQKQDALRDGAAGREQARALIPQIVEARETLALLDEERALLATDERRLAAAREAEVLRLFERQVRTKVKRVTGAIAAIEGRLDGLAADMRGLHGALQDFFAMADHVSPPAEAHRRLVTWPWWNGIIERVATIVTDTLGRNPTPVPLLAPVRALGEHVGDPEDLVAAIMRDATRPEALAARYADAPALAEAVAQVLAEGRDD
jgi:hypothetical protein